MNRNKKLTTLAIAAIAATMALTAATLTIPQQALAWGHHHHHDNGIKVDQQVNQLNVCSGQAPDHVELVRASGTLCVNQANNNADVQK